MKFEQLAGATDTAETIAWTDSMSAFSTLGAALFAALAAGIALKVYWSDKTHRRRQDIRMATAELIRAMHDLAARSKNSTSDNEADRNAMYLASIMFELAVGEKLDRNRFNAAMNWILKAARIRYDNACEAANGGQLLTSRWMYCGKLVFEAIEALRTFDVSGGKSDLASDLATRFDELFTEGGYGKDAKIHKSLIVEDKYYERLVLHPIPEFAPQ